jgi:hypothetical protein
MVISPKNKQPEKPKQNKKAPKDDQLHKIKAKQRRVLTSESDDEEEEKKFDKFKKQMKDEHYFSSSSESRQSVFNTKPKPAVGKPSKTTKTKIIKKKFVDNKKHS